jgi:hypothetical protein
MKFAFKFEYGSRFQRFEIRTYDNSISFSRISAKSYSERWYTLRTSASLSTDPDFVYRSSAENIAFSMGKTYQRMLSAEARSALADAQSDYVYDYEQEMDDLYGTGVWPEHRADGSYTTDARMAWDRTPPF